ncbi:bifunctional 4-hydroxy-2-oxoglutarate aldolase/2-dehydro-3-deoxy-phosphogluconate aldolase [Dactylosporangium aurantiacum]|uniref:Bifunctional 4-hydroxy-2-oxoglutarate aldolase/2-dehydro-3-deoxy-phosphogluconate aldolase n=1 Tax=Dactylosporangium aurantiacum TaxID=35754 RepID=A0A9Q9IMJ5_9ACTN|nr:bifunctional 4-hydroxy-2-oxoglutarate aldolase/2-dehydro-3-deoxy-phosphogluconate aldolase [Dactylosporangium aurantiacum]MDG6109155.1 bifunctional 4-hydroxy-2-oxoglutarate aldolase/2-dehydro-3-deoxy-phosphogluconate aldolase [Dactylosporangium aurantiacum]UWZ56557.1 bifunctional 4-hydroxy-2-oxoglutarate aldolase/2-dehydro-3-deoxy-phosphogluconate aldolase [Dactylosporangium aurantiacum]
MTFDELLDGRPLVAILRGVPIPRALQIARAVWDSGLGVVEVPIQNPAAVECLRALAGHGHPVGAGTVRSPEQVAVAAEAGAVFTVAPGLDLDVVRASHDAGLPHLPGVATASEVHHALRAGCHWLKAFPAGSLGPGWLREMRGPFPEAKFVATGGVGAHNARDYLTAGARALGVGGAVTRDGGLPPLLEVLRTT